MMLWKVVGSFAFMTVCHVCASIVVITVNDRLPDRKKYPPLPDIVLDNIRYQHWAGAASEWCLITLMAMWFLLVFVHKQRLIIMLRGFSLTGVLYLLRCLCVLVTAIPVPDVNKRCDVYPDSDIWNKLERAFSFYACMGLKVAGSVTCGDYIFSGHTMMLTMFNLFLNEYTPKSMRYVHITSWIMNILGIFFILSCRGHYTIDVVLAFFISAQMFSLYHTLAVNRHGKKENVLTSLCMPLVRWLEADITEDIRNELEWPFRNTDYKLLETA